MTHVNTPARRTHPLIAALVAAFVIVLVECFVFNFACLRSHSARPANASQSLIEQGANGTANPQVTLGPGLALHGNGLLRVTDATKAYVDVPSNGSSPYAQVLMTSPNNIARARTTMTQAQRDELYRELVHVRLDGGRMQTVAVNAPRSTYLPYQDSETRHAQPNGDHTVRLWIEEATDSLIPIVGLDANAHVPFSWNWAQVLLMAAFAALLIAFSPRSRLWLMPLDTGSRLQRGAFTIGALALAGYTAVQIYWQIAGAAPMAYHTPGRYSYDYDQYDHVAQALMNGHAWLDLPVPEQFAQLHNPYDTAARDHLLEQGVTHIYWDYAYHDGHWYSYFGVLPALLLFLPYRAITSLFVPGGLMLPNASADMLLMFGAAIFGCLLVIRLLKRMPVQVSVATCALSCLAFVLGSNLLYFWHRTNFYSIPFASGLCLTFLGMWLWLGAPVARKRTCTLGRSDSADASPSLSLRHVAFGALCIAATVGCRPTFALTALLAIALFFPQVRAVFSASTWRERAMRIQALRFLCALIIPAMLIVIPVIAYNAMRFGSFTDFGNAYQITVANMTDFHTPLSQMPRALCYYLFLPLTFGNDFPWLELTAAPTPTWFFTETTPAGLFVLMPLALLAFAVPFMRRPLGRLYATLTSMLALAMVLLVFDAYVGGFAWRYLADFSWLVMLCALAVTAWLVERHPVWRVVFVIVLVYAIMLALASMFVIGRDDAMINIMPSRFADVRSWFTLLP